MPEQVKKYGINAILLMIFGSFLIPVVVYVASQAAHVPELKVEIKHLSKSIDRLVTGLDTFAVSNDTSHQLLIEGFNKNTEEIKTMKHDCDDHSIAIEKLQNGH